MCYIKWGCVYFSAARCVRGDVAMEVVVPLAVVLLAVSAAPNATRRRPDELPDEPVLPDDDDEINHRLDYYDEEKINISG